MCPWNGKWKKKISLMLSLFIQVCQNLYWDGFRKVSIFTWFILFQKGFNVNSFFMRIVPNVFSPPRNVNFSTNFWARSHSLFDTPCVLLLQFYYYLPFIKSKMSPPIESTDQHNESTFGISGTSSIFFLSFECTSYVCRIWVYFYEFSFDVTEKFIILLLYYYYRRVKDKKEIKNEFQFFLITVQIPKSACRHLFNEIVKSIAQRWGKWKIW